jgi:hypothetical protein
MENVSRRSQSTSHSLLEGLTLTNGNRPLYDFKFRIITLRFDYKRRATPRLIREKTSLRTSVNTSIFDYALQVNVLGECEHSKSPEVMNLEKVASTDSRIALPTNVPARIEGTNFMVTFKSLDAAQNA